MNRTLIHKELKSLRWKLLVAFLALVVVTLVMIVLHEQLLEFLPTDQSELPSFVTSEMLESFGDYTNAMWLNLNDKNLIQIGCILAIVLGIGLLAPEIESETITLLLTNGLSRKKVFWTKTIIVIIALASLLLTVSALLVPLSSIFGYTLRHLRSIPTTLVTVLGLSFVFAVSLLISLFLKDRIWSGIASALLFGLWSVLGFWKSTRIFSLFYHMRAADYFFGERSFPWLTALGFAVATAIVLLLAANRFEQEEL